MDLDLNQSSSDEDTGVLKKKMLGATKKQKISSEGTTSDTFKSIKDSRTQRDSMLKQKRQKKDEDGGHVTKYSGNAYVSNKGKGDVLKAGKYEPFAYIQLNPKMLNKRNKEKAVKSFENVVSHGKKVGKRSEKKTDGLLSGMGFKKAQ